MATLADNLIEQLRSRGVRHGFSVPGDYVLGFLSRLYESKQIEMVPTTSEWEAGYAADAYARTNGMGLAVVTYNVGGFNLLNAVACAYAEKSPLVVISGSPGVRERSDKTLLHHMVKNFTCQADVFRNVTVASTVLSDPLRAAYEIDRVLEACRAYRQPVYIELPRDMVDRPVTYDQDNFGPPPVPKSDRDVLEEAVAAAVQYLNGAERPVILAGVEVSRFGLGEKLVKFAERTNIQVATTMLGKGVMDERHPLALGVYAGHLSDERSRKVIEESDCVLMLGVMQTDINFGFMPAKVVTKNAIRSTADEMAIRNSHYRDVFMVDFFKDLCDADVKPRPSRSVTEYPEPADWEPRAGKPITVVRLFEKVDSILDDSMAVIAEPGDSLFGSIDLTVHDTNAFICPAFYTTMGMAVPAALGVIKATGKRPLVFVGDGAFQMTAVGALSSIRRAGGNPIVFVLNNRGYGTERVLHDGPWNDIADWKYDKVTEMVGGVGYRVTTEQELDEAVAASLRSKDVSVINVVVQKDDYSPALKRFSSRFKGRI